ncbi:unnamed protein product [Mytilus edulis]|uniref:Uncharacterized protein n=1 Tax=Mytilus edulis TaxID=6550 RepID=A0A8S3SZ53_MYTED|nr:unnamed protein product [Mytilus edulis]
MEKTITGITFLKGIPTPNIIDDFTREKRHRLVNIDDLGHEVVRNQAMELIFTQGCHHRKLSCIFLNQNLYLGGSKARTIALNTTYLILMKNLRDVSQISMLGRQIYPGRRHMLMEAYRDAKSKPFGYLVLDLAAHVSDTYRLQITVESIKIITILRRKTATRKDKLKVLDRAPSVIVLFVESCGSQIMEKMILLPYEKYEKLQTRSLRVDQSTKLIDGGGLNTGEKLGPPGTLEKRNVSRGMKRKLTLNERENKTEKGKSETSGESMDRNIHWISFK